MKYISALALSFLTAGCALAQTSVTRYEWRATLKAVDESGNPVSGANAQIGYYTNSQPANAEGITDTNGIFAASHAALATMVEVSCQAEKPGYYRTWVRRELGPKYDPAQWTFTQTLVLKQIGKPIPMYAKSVNLGMPIIDKPAGFDLTVGDWVAPYGKGIAGDIVFVAHLDQRAENDADYKLTLSFPRAGDGIQEFTVPDAERGSDLRSPHEAPADGYQSQWVQFRSRKPGKPETSNVDANRNFVFRVRTVLDGQGRVVSACYGKIYGDFLQFRYYFNPTPNSRNIEFDPKQNLLGGIRSFERVAAP